MANEVDGFLPAASERLGEEGMRYASRAASSGRRMELPGIGREHQDGLDELARHFAQAHDGKELTTAWERQRARAEERGRRGLLPEPEQDRERQ